MFKQFLVTLAAIALILSGCSAPGSDAVESNSMSDLRTHVRHGGVPCDMYEQRDPQLTPATELGECNLTAVLAMFPGHDDVRTWAFTIFDLGKNVLIGERWAVSADLAVLRNLQESMGGQIVDDELVESAMKGH